MFCIGAEFGDGGIFNLPGENPVAICIEYEDELGNDCSPLNSVYLQVGTNKTCIVKNYIISSLVID